MPIKSNAWTLKRSHRLLNSDPIFARFPFFANITVTTFERETKKWRLFPILSLWLQGIVCHSEQYGGILFSWTSWHSRRWNVLRLCFHYLKNGVSYHVWSASVGCKYLWKQLTLIHTFNHHVDFYFYFIFLWNYPPISRTKAVDSSILAAIWWALICPLVQRVSWQGVHCQRLPIVWNASRD